MHTHPALVNGLTCSVQGEKAARELLGDEVLWVPTMNPGYVLAAEVRGRVVAHRARFGREPEVMLLENHGLVVAGGGAAEVRSARSG